MNEHNKDTSIDQLDENECIDMTKEEATMPVQHCDVPTLTSSQPVQCTREIKPSARYYYAQGKLFKVQGDVISNNNSCNIII